MKNNPSAIETHKQTIVRIRENSAECVGSLNDWELSFLDDLYPYESISDKQAAILHKLKVKVLGND